MNTSAASPHIAPQLALQKVLLACAPVLLAMIYLQGWGALFQLSLALTTCCGCDWLIQRWLQHPPRTLLWQQPCLGDGSAVVSALLLTLALPSYAPWWLMLCSAAFASILGKAVFGGSGHNPINPAMLGVAFALIAFPAQMLDWPAEHVEFIPALQQVFTLSALPDGWSQATALDALHSNDRLTQDELFRHNPAFGSFAGIHSQWLNLLALLGGLWLIQQKVIDWRAPVGMLSALFLASLVLWNGTGSTSHGSPLLHLFSGGTMLCAFFICTEPVSGARSPRGRLYFGIGVGLLTYAIRTWASYPDGIAFAVLIMNLLVLRLDQWGQKR